MVVHTYAPVDRDESFTFTPGLTLLAHTLNADVPRLVTWALGFEYLSVRNEE